MPSENDDSQRIALAVAALARGKICCLPTETSYGLSVDIRQSQTLDRLSALKQRDAAAPFVVLVANLDQAKSLASVWPDRASELAARYWPGPLTLVVAAGQDLPHHVVSPQGTVAMRHSSHRWIEPIVTGLGAPITSTSANLRGCDPAMSIAMARSYFANDVQHYMDDGDLASSAPSTLIQVPLAGPCTVLRKGALTIPDSELA